MSDFWCVYPDLPAGKGFGLFTPAHWGMLALCALLIAGISALFSCLTRDEGRKASACIDRYEKSSAKNPNAKIFNPNLNLELCCHNLSKKREDAFLRILSLLILGGNILRDLFLLSVHRMSIAYLPLHLCSLSIFVYLLYAFLPARHRRLRAFFGEVSAVLCAPGALTALLFPDWSAYPLFSFMSLHSFVWHALLIAFPILLLQRGAIRPCLRHIWMPILYLFVITPPIWLFDDITGCNYLFVRVPLAGTPLELLADSFGAGWRVSYAALVFIVILLVYAVFALLRRYGILPAANAERVSPHKTHT